MILFDLSKVMMELTGTFSDDYDERNAADSFKLPVTTLSTQLSEEERKISINSVISVVYIV